MNFGITKSSTNFRFVSYVVVSLLVIELIQLARYWRIMKSRGDTCPVCDQTREAYRARVLAREVKV